jgi:predicted HD superfamily hydrolase involved in NAD metabolism
MNEFINKVMKSVWWYKLDEFRKNHIIEVKNKSLEYNKKFNLNIDEKLVIQAAYLHDIGKGLHENEELEIIKKNNIFLDDIEKMNRALFHAPISEFISSSFFGITDKKVLNAIRYHTVAREEMTSLDKLIYFADFIAPDRKFEINKDIEPNYKLGLNKLIITITTAKIKFLLSTLKIIHPNIIKLRNKLLLV